ncbi:shikimate dehydrogenase [Gemmatimonadota bacterium]
MTSKTRVFALLGDPVTHSLSPVIQNAGIRALGLDGVYVALRVGPEDLVGFVRGLARAGGGGNITLPHKERATTLLDVPTEAVRRTGACNTFWGEEGKIHGDNTDVAGFSRALSGFLGGVPEGLKVLLLGAGGSARACLVALIDGAVEEVSLLNRTPDRARAVARRIGGQRVRVLDDVKQISGGGFDLVINTTSMGLGQSDPLPVDLEIFGRVGGVVDLVYGPQGTPFVRRARELGIRAADGAEMLLQQGAASFECWWGRPPDLEPMRQALEKCLSH